jgi:uncharacterized phosphosugar-binding protein
MLDRYVDAASQALGEVAATQRLALDAYARAGGLACVNPILDAVPVEVALGCRKRGLRVVALTNLEQAKRTAPRHPSGARLHELADAELLLEQSRRPPVLAGQNLDGRPAAEDNAELLRPNLGRVRRRA